ncbi:hypothetical protein KUV57_13405 [Epibacterium sp. DP7N7-1]|nr:hypothetical protein [Epibacterium sp. DP7N7-1]
MNDAPSYVLPAGSNPGEVQKRLILAFAKNGRPKSNQVLTDRLLKSVTIDSKRIKKASLHAWLSGRTIPQKNSIAPIEKVLMLPIGTIRNGEPDDPLEAEIPKLPLGFKSVWKVLAPLGISEIGCRVVMALSRNDPTSPTQLASTISALLLERSGISFPVSLILSWLTGRITPSELEVEILGAALSLPSGWLKTGTRRVSSRDRSVELREMSSKLITQMRSWDTIKHEYGDVAFSEDFRTRLSIALVIRGALSNLEATDDDIISGAKYLMHMHFLMHHDTDGNISIPPSNEIKDLASRCGVEARWLAENKTSEHSVVRHALGWQDIQT